MNITVHHADTNQAIEIETKTIIGFGNVPNCAECFIDIAGGDIIPVKEDLLTLCELIQPRITKGCKL